MLILTVSIIVRPEYTVAVPGVYRVSGNIYNGGSLTANTGQIEFYVNVAGSKVAYTSNSVGASTSDGASISTLVKVVAGEAITISVYQNNGAARNFNVDFTVERLAGPSLIAATELISSRYYVGTAQNITASGTIINFDAKSKDTHGSVSTGAAWKFSASAQGTYQVIVGLEGINLTAGSSFVGRLNKNGASVSTAFGAGRDDDATKQFINFNDTIDLLAGDYIDFRMDSTDASWDTVAGGATDQRGYISINRIK